MGSLSGKDIGKAQGKVLYADRSFQKYSKDYKLGYR